MRYLFTGLLFIMLLLLLPGTKAICGNNPAPLQLKLMQSPTGTQAPKNSQIVDIHDIKGPVSLPDTGRFIRPVAAGIVILIIAALLFYYLKRRQKPEAPAIPPDVVALSELDRAKNLMTKEYSLLYAERISKILRQYIESRFQIRSTRQTTREFFSRLKDGTTIAEVDIKNHAGDLQRCLEQCDIAKFARGTPDIEDMLQMDTAARIFIKTTGQNPETGVDGQQPASEKKISRKEGKAGQ